MKNNSIDKDKPIFPISTIADMLNIHPRTLRIYDEAQILSPKRSAKNRRLYSFKDMEKGKLIQFLTRCLGVNLVGVKIIIRLLENSKIKESTYLKSVEKIAKIINEKLNK